MKIFTIGKSFVADHLNYKNIEDRLDFSEKLISAILDKYKPDVLINCIAKTGRPNIDWCEVNKAITASTNTALPIILADICEKKSIHLIQIGSGCIYYGKSPNIINNIDYGWRESDVPNPESFYSKSKYACDLILGSMKNVSTLRIRMPISTKNNPRNLINKLRNYDKIIDIPNSMTFMSDLAKCVEWVIKNTNTGIYHVTNPEPITAAQIMKEYQKYKPYVFEIIDESKLDSLTIAKRSNCILNSDKLQRAGFFMTSSEETLKLCMADYIKNIGD